MITSEIHDFTRRALAAEIAALQQMDLDPGSLNRAIQFIISCTTQVLVTGIGKSGLVAQRIAATLALAGVRAWYLHPADALHGDLARVREGDVLVVVSRGGESAEVIGVADHCVSLEIPIILITSEPRSTLGRMSTCVLQHPGKEACVLGLIPTSSATAAGVVGDMLVLNVQAVLGTSRQQFVEVHPNGALGKRLNVTVREVMVDGDDVGTITPAQSLFSAMVELARKRGTLAVCCDEKKQRCIGVITAGDITRYVEHRGDGWLAEPVMSVITEDAHTTPSSALARVVLEEMQTAGIMAMPVVDDGQLVGMVHLHDILRAGVR